MCHRHASETTGHLRNGRPVRNQRASIVSAVHRGSLEPPHTKHSRVGGHYHPEGAARCPPIVPLPPLRNSSPLRNEGASHSERGALTATSSCRHSPFLPRFYPVFTPFCSVFIPLLYPVFTPFSFVVLPHFYPVFTPSRSIVFTPVLPRFYPTFTPPPVFTLSSVLPRFYPVPSTLRTPIPPFLPQG